MIFLNKVLLIVFIPLLPVQPVGQLLYFVGNGQFPAPLGTSLLYTIFAVPSSVFGIISEYISAARLQRHAFSTVGTISGISGTPSASAPAARLQWHKAINRIS
jgi:hypothetical protein